MEHIADVLAVLLMKLTAMYVGYCIVKLGYDALIRGIKGEFDFGGKVADKVEIKLLSASPGLFFVLFGSAIIIWSITVDKPVSFSNEKIHHPEPVTDLEPQSMEPRE